MEPLFADDERFAAPIYDDAGHFADAWRWFGAADEPAGDGWPETCGDWRLRQWRDVDAHVMAWRRSEAWRTRPFRFEDLNGNCEPLSFGPAYPKTASAAVEKWRRLARGRELSEGEAAAYGQAVHAWIGGLNAPKRAPGAVSTRSGCASGQAGPFCAKKHRAALLAKLHRDAAADRLRRSDRQIVDAYEWAMRQKKAQLPAVEMAEAA